MFQNTYTNADKLLEAAEQLAQTGECDPEEIYQAAHQLEDRIQDFVRRVEQRKVLLDMSVAFHTHVKEVCVLFSSFSSTLMSLSHNDNESVYRKMNAIFTTEQILLPDRVYHRYFVMLNLSLNIKNHVVIGFYLPY